MDQTTDSPTQSEKLEPCPLCHGRAIVRSSPVPSEALARASKLCRSTIPGARVELIFQSLQDAQAVHKWLCNLNMPATPTPVEQWRDEGGHAWERRSNVDCVECPHCCFMFAAIHGDGDGDGYSCPNCEGCPDTKATPSPSLAAREAAERAVRKLNSIGYLDTMFMHRQGITDIIPPAAEIIAAEFAHCSPVPAAGGDEDQRPSCWHCGVVLAYTPKLRCEDCPNECDKEGCDEMGCAADSVGEEGK